ncbi:TetR/AcrR family transcriptional regulator [Umezawaea endophytica]|uniref:TetR family transcriptional regulator n=1 Tax=Umezawaea endophytica TaxID=1654476 RepID=A0A9X2VI28_9PSEU|nr:TetR family transcriptional regulator [Umezawaea endophytica]MCS7476966.1 TetR family transcriptional regulator [Umezawaea endophytica]
MTGCRVLTTRGAARRTALLDAAIAVVAESGSGSLTHRTVASTAKASLASVSYHFSSIEDLRRSMFERALEVVDGQLTETAAAGTPNDLPRLMADYVVALLTRHRSAAAAVQEMIVAATHDAALRSTFHEYHERLADLLAPCVGGRAAGLAVAASVQGLIVTALTYPGSDTDGFHAAVVDLIDRVSTLR